MSHQLEIERRGQAARSAADDGDALAGGRIRLDGRHVQGIVDREVLESADVDRVVDHISAAARLTRMLADIGTGGRERIVLADELDRVGIPSGADEGDVARDVDMSRTQGDTRHRLGQSARTAVVLDMFDVIVAEALDAAQNHGGGLIADGTVGGIRNGARGLFDPRNGVQRRAFAEDVVHQVGELAESDAAGHTLAAGLGMAELEEAKRDINRAESRRAGGNTPFEVLIQTLDDLLRLIRGFQTESAQIHSLLVSLSQFLGIGYRKERKTYQ